MGFLLSLSLKNLFRYRRRTLITAMAIAAGISMYIFMDGWLLGADQESVRNLVRYETGSARIFEKTYWEEHEFLLPKYNIKDPDTITSALEAKNYAVTPRITIWADVYKTGSPADSIPLQLAGVDPATDGKIFALESALSTGKSEGRYIAAGSPDILLGYDVAERLDLKLNDTIEISTKTKDGVWTGMQARVAGILDTPDPIVNNAMGFVAIDSLAGILQMEGMVTDIVIGFPEWADEEKETGEINTILASLSGVSNYTAKSYNTIASEFGLISQTKSAGTKFILFLIFIIAAIGVSNTMLMAVYERVREIGMMRALGMKDRAILASFFMEAMGIGLVGTVIGVALGVLANIYMVNVGIDLSPFLKDMGNIGYRIAGISKSAWNIETILIGGLVCIPFAGLVAVFPARRALRKQITDCLRVK